MIMTKMAALDGSNYIKHIKYILFFVNSIKDTISVSVNKKLQKKPVTTI